MKVSRDERHSQKRTLSQSLKNKIKRKKQRLSSSSSSVSSSSTSTSSSSSSISTASSGTSSDSDYKNKRKQKSKRKARSPSTDTSSSSSSSNASFQRKQKRKSENAKQKKLKTKLKTCKKSPKTSGNKDSKIKSGESSEDVSADVPLHLMEKSRTMAPMTKDQWEKQQSVVKRVYDESSGRHRLIKGDGEVVEEIVSKEQQKSINKQATKGDGDYFQKKVSGNLLQ